jgi:hypothetical protein
MKYEKIEDAYEHRINECKKVETKLFSLMVKLQEEDNSFIKRQLNSQIDLLKIEYANFNIYKIKSLI